MCVFSLKPATYFDGAYKMISDLAAAWAHHDLWLYLAWQDIRLRYRRSRIGPFWITASMAIFCGTLGVIYAGLFKTDISEYMPFLSIGFVFWALISGMLNEFPNIYVENASYITDIRINPFAILLRATVRHLITLAHNLLIVVGVYAYFGINPGPVALLTIPAVILVTLNLLALGVSLSMLGARFRDITPITQNLVQVIFFVTPLTWLPRLLPADSLVVVLNPFAHYIDILRAPLLGQMPDPMSWLVSLVTLAIFVTLSALLYRKRAHRIPFWV